MSYPHIGERVLRDAFTPPAAPSEAEKAFGSCWGMLRKGFRNLRKPFENSMTLKGGLAMKPTKTLRYGMRHGLGALLIIFLALAFLASCAPKKPVPVSVEDNPTHHYLQGMLAIEKGDYTLAGGKFDRALYLDKKFGPAWAGKSLVLAKKTADEKDAAHKEVDLKETFAALKKAKKYADSKEHKFSVYVTAMRVYTMVKTKGWLDESKDAYDAAMAIEGLNESGLPYYLNRDAADYFMGMAYYEAHDFRKAEAIFAKILSARGEGKWQGKANATYKKVQKIVRASANYTLTNTAANIAVKDEVTRGDVTALLVDELKIDRLFAGRIPVKSELAKMKADYTPADVVDHPFKSEIETLMKWKVRGLEPTFEPDTRAWLFKPQEPVARKALALSLEDVIIKLTGDERIATVNLGSDKSPFPDVQPSAPWFNAVVTVTIRGLMEPELSGEFRPDDPADGAELLLAIFKLRQVLNIH